jgi:hypothetical protein
MIDVLMPHTDRFRSTPNLLSTVPRNADFKYVETIWDGVTYRVKAVPRSTTDTPQQVAADVVAKLDAILAERDRARDFQAILEIAQQRIAELPIDADNPNPGTEAVLDALYRAQLLPPTDES